MKKLEKEKRQKLEEEKLKIQQEEEEKNRIAKGTFPNTK